MLTLVEDDQRKRALHAQMKKLLLDVLPPVGRFKIPNAGGGEPNPRKGGKKPMVYAEVPSRSPDRLFYAPISRATTGGERTWNALGFFDPSRKTQKNIVQTNIPFGTNSTGAAAGFFAEDIKSKRIYLMHTGQFSGLRKQDVLRYFDDECMKVRTNLGNTRIGIRISSLDNRLARRLKQFVLRVRDYKKKIRDKAASA